MELEMLGWTPVWAQAFDSLGHATTAGLRPARVAAVHRTIYRLLADDGEPVATLSGRLRASADGMADLPTVGDWVAFAASDNRRAIVHARLPRLSSITRKSAGTTSDRQVLAANVDVILLVMGLDGDFNLRRLERALVMVAASGAAPVVVLNKLDLAPDAAERRRMVEAIAPSVPLLLVSAVESIGLDALAPYLGRGTTVALIGSSGVGKSTLANRLLGGERLATAVVRPHDQRGRHTTTARHLLVLPCGAVLIDTPGLREIQLGVTDDAAVDAAFEDIASLAASCRYRDCRHDIEPDCAVQEAAARGALAAERLANLRKLRREIDYEATRADPERQRAQKAKWKAIHKAARHRRPRGWD
jgi:ribosome biogenesis GTPase